MKHFEVELNVENVHVTFGSQLVFPPTGEEKEVLTGLVMGHDRVIIDIRHTDTLSMSWIRVLADLTTVAEVATQGELFVVGANNAIKSTIDIAKLADRIRLFDSVEEIGDHDIH